MGVAQETDYFYYFRSFLHLFFTRKFIVHRVTGLTYLLLYFATFVYYFLDYERFKDSPLIWLLPSIGLFQSITAIYTFTFLPKSTKDPGYYGDKGILSYNFIVENSFFELILLFQWIYYNDFLFGYLRSTVVFENLFVFLPYVIRGFWPKTRFRDGLENVKNKTEKNFNFFIVETWITKFFYVWAKHYIGFFLNYVRFLDRISEEEKHHIYLVLIFGAFATTISMFLHTLKFKGYMNAKLSFLIYQASYMATFYGFFKVSGIFLANLDLTLLTLGGLLINFAGVGYQHAYQLLVLGLLNASRLGVLPQELRIL